MAVAKADEVLQRRIRFDAQGGNALLAAVSMRIDGARIRKNEVVEAA
jgi:hypothetical protein